MTYLTTGSRGTVSTLNSSSSISTPGYALRQNTLQSATSTTVTLDVGASAIDDYYNNLLIEILSGTAKGMRGIITDYDGTTKVATVTFALVADSTSEFIIYRHSGLMAEQTDIDNHLQVKLASHASAYDDFYNNSYILLLGSSAVTHIHKITDYNGTTKIASVETPCTLTITEEFMYIISSESGTAASGTSNTLTLQTSHGHDTTDDAYNNLMIEIYSGTGAGQCRMISDYNGTTLVATVVNDWTTTPDSTSVYMIYDGWCGQIEDCSQYSQVTSALVLNSNSNYLFQSILATNNTGTTFRQKDYHNYLNNTSSSVHTLAII